MAGWLVHFWTVKDKYFLWLDALSRPVNNLINILIKLKIILYHGFLLIIYGYR